MARSEKEKMLAGELYNAILAALLNHAPLSGELGDDGEDWGA
jgi:hypothetical protein